MIQLLKDYLTIILSIVSLIVWGYTCLKFLSKPHANLEARVADLEKDVREIKQSLKEGNDKFREQAKLNAVFKAVNLAFIDFEISYCMNTGYKDIADLKKAKRILQNSLAGYGNDEEDEKSD